MDSKTETISMDATGIGKMTEIAQHKKIRRHMLPECTPKRTILYPKVDVVGYASDDGAGRRIVLHLEKASSEKRGTHAFANGIKPPLNSFRRLVGDIANDNDWQRTPFLRLGFIVIPGELRMRQHLLHQHLHRRFKIVHRRSFRRPWHDFRGIGILSSTLLL